MSNFDNLSREEWDDILDEKGPEGIDLEAILKDWKAAEAEWDKRPVEWGNCRRGCPPAYIDREGFCSPACKLGAPRGEHVTVAVAKAS